MPSDEAYDAVLKVLTDMADAWRAHRESINRAVGMLSEEVFRFDKRMRDDMQVRLDRQQEVDTKLHNIQRWQWIRLSVELIVIIAVAAYLIGVAH